MSASPPPLPCRRTDKDPLQGPLGIALVVLGAIIGLGLTYAGFELENNPEFLDVIQIESEIPPQLKQRLVEKGIVEADERVLYCYSSDFVSIVGEDAIEDDDNGEVITDRRVISFYTFGDDEQVLWQENYANIRSIEVVEWGSLFDYTEVKVVIQDDEFFLHLSAELGRDRQAVDTMKELWRKARRKDATGINDTNASPTSASTHSETNRSSD